MNTANKGIDNNWEKIELTCNWFYSSCMITIKKYESKQLLLI